MENNIILKAGKVYQVIEVEVDVNSLRNQLTDKRAGIQQQESDCAELQAKIDYIEQLIANPQ